MTEAFIAILTTAITTAMLVVVARERAMFLEKREEVFLEARRLLEIKSPSRGRRDTIPEHKHRFKNESVIEVRDLLEEEILNYLCPECLASVRPWYTPVMALDRPDHGQMVISAWLDKE